MQTVPLAVKRSPVASFGSNFSTKDLTTKDLSNKDLTNKKLLTKVPKWESHALKPPLEPRPSNTLQEERTISLPTQAVPTVKKAKTAQESDSAALFKGKEISLENKEVSPSPASKAALEGQTTLSPATAAESKPRRQLRPKRALITLTDNAVKHLRALLDHPDPKLIRIGVKNRGCSGLSYHLEYVQEPGKFDETVEQNGVKVLIDSKALFSIVGSEMDWLDDELSERFVFKNPQSKGTCGCGESFMV